MSSGSIFRQQRAGKTVWIVEVVIGYKPDGTRIRTRRTCHSKSEANRTRADLLAKAHAGELAPISKETLDSFAIWWIRTVKAPQVRPATAGDYEARYRHAISPVFGHRKIVDITSRDVANWLHGLSEHGFAVATINGHRQVLQMLMRAATQYGHRRDNPVDAVPKHKPRYNQTTRVQPPWDQHEATRALHLAKGTPIELALTLGLVVGMRRSEILGLTWTDFDFEHATLHIRRVIREVRTLDTHGKARVTVEIYGPKNPTSSRKIHLGPLVTTALLNHRTAQAQRGHYRDDGWVFTTTTGTLMPPARLWLLYRQFLTTSGLRYIRFHDLRHSSANLALSGRARIEAVSQFLGHSNINTTKSIYAPYVEALNHEYIHAIEDQLGPFTPQQPATPTPPPPRVRGH